MAQTPDTFTIVKDGIPYINIPLLVLALADAHDDLLIQTDPRTDKYVAGKLVGIQAIVETLMNFGDKALAKPTLTVVPPLESDSQVGMYL